MGREVAEQATKRRGRVRRFLAWLGYGPEAELEERPDRDARRARGKAEAAERRAKRRAERLARREVQGAEGPEHRLAEMEARALSAQQEAEEARTQVADAQASADRARAAAEEARHGIDAISTKLARVEAERRVHEQAARRLEVRCAELRSELRMEREEKTVIVEHFDRRLEAIEAAADAAVKRVAAAERELIRGTDRPWFDGGGRVERASRARNGDPLDALEATLGKPRRDGRDREVSRSRSDARERSRAG